MNNFTLAPLLEVTVIVVLIIATRLLIPWIKTKTDEAQQQKIDTILDALVRAAEQMIGVDGSGETKLAMVKGLLEERGIDASREDIEAAVYRLNIEQESW